MHIINENIAELCFENKKVFMIFLSILLHQWWHQVAVYMLNFTSVVYLVVSGDDRHSSGEKYQFI